MRYAVGAGSRLTVKARSRIHDTTTAWTAVTGTVDAEPATIETTGAQVAIAVDMTVFDAGDFLKNRKLRKDFDLEAHPQARFELASLADVRRTLRHGDGLRPSPAQDARICELTATARGTLRWRGREVALTITGTGVLDDTHLDVKASFDLDIRQLGLAAPRFLMFKMEDEVTVEVVVRGART